MANFPKMVLTSKGITLQAKVQGGAQLVLTRMALGDGQLAGTPISGLNALVSQKATLPLTGGKRVSTQTYQVEAFFSNSTISTGFWWREWGVFATDPDVGDILYCYANAGDAGDYIAPATDTRIEKHLFASMAIGNASNITVEVSSSDIYITAQELSAHSNDATKHIGTAAKTAPVDGDSFSLVDSADGNKLKRLTLANLKTTLQSFFAYLGGDGKIPAALLPSYVDDVLEYTTLSSFPASGETGKIYVALDSNKCYRWGGSGYVEISQSIALGETSATAYRGDRGKIAYDHSQATGNPHGMTAAQVGAYTKEESLSAAIKTLYGVLTNATPSDVFSKIYSMLNVKPFVSGIYTGNGSAYPSSQSISLGFTPSAVLVEADGYNRRQGVVYGGLVIPGYPVISQGNAKGLEITSGGFTAYSAIGVSGYDAYCNSTGAKYHYIAFR